MGDGTLPVYSNSISPVTHQNMGGSEEQWVTQARALSIAPHMQGLDGSDLRGATTVGCLTPPLAQNDAGEDMVRGLTYLIHPLYMLIWTGLSRIWTWMCR